MLKIGAASTIITNHLGTTIQGATVGGVARYVRDDLEANALHLQTADTSTLIISCDLGGLEPDMTDRTCQAISEKTGLDRECIILGATHTGGPSVIPTNYRKPVDRDYLGRLQDQLTDLAAEALGAAVPAELAVEKGQAAIGYNRRICQANGMHSMQGTQASTDFTGVEGPADADQLAVFARDEQGELIAVLHQNTAHPCSFYGADFYSADFPGYARSIIRSAVRDDLPVLFFNGAFGDQGQEKRYLPIVPEPQERKMIRCGAQLAGETLRLLHEADFQADLPLASTYRAMEASVLLPDAARLADARAILQQVDAGQEIAPFEIVRAHGANLLQERFGRNPTEQIPLHALRLGQAAIVTQGTELFCQFGIDIKRRSPFRHTAVFSICDGYRGYCPTFEAVIGGGYSAEPIYWTRFSPETGYRLVDTACDLLHDLYQEEPVRV